MSGELRATVDRWLLGPRSTFRNGRRKWLYLGYLTAVLTLLAAAALRR